MARTRTAGTAAQDAASGQNTTKGARTTPPKKKTAKKTAATRKKTGPKDSAEDAEGTAKGSRKAGARARAGAAAKGGDARGARATSKLRSPGTPGRKTGDAAPAPAPAGERLPVAARVLIMVVAFAAMVAFAVVLSKLTLQPSQASESLTHSNLHPGDSIRAYLDQPAFRDTVKQLGGNVVLGMPFGALLPVLAPRLRGLLRVMVATALVMLLVELVQGALVTGRAFDVDDVILNTTGAVLGYLLLGRRLGRAVHPRRRHWWHRFAKKPAGE